MKVDASISGQKAFETLGEPTTKWRSLIVSYALQLIIGIQFSIYVTSMWPYLAKLEPSSTLNFFGWIMAVFSVGQMVSSKIFGYWVQKTWSSKNPTICGFVFIIIGNFIYALLPLLTSNHGWFMMLSRIIVGIGSGNLCVLRGYCSMSTKKDDISRVMPLAAGSYVLGLALGPAIQSAFVFVGSGFSIGMVIFDFYTLPAYLMALVSFGSILVVLFYFDENYAGILTSNETKDPYVVVPKFDKIAAYTCIYLYFMLQAITTSIEVLATPFTITLYNWTDKQAVLYGGILQFIGCIMDVTNYLALSFTKLGKIDKRVLIIGSSLAFIAYHLLLLPWDFYDGPLDYVKLVENSTVKDQEFGGCLREYTWCSHTTRVPLVIYIFGFTVVLSFAFPYTAASVSVLYSEILGPRNQGSMQGTMEFFGSFARCVIPVIQPILFADYGYLWPFLMNLFTVLIGLTFLVLFFHRIIPLEVIPRVGVPTPYKSGVFYRL
uniref:MFS domain-containing protein n=1 Tax=Syphacia muris TaxID=451379 RepID=A0A0N5AG22_9BILA